MVKVIERDDRGLITRVIEADAADPLLTRIAELERECGDVRSQLSEAEARRATEVNRLNAEQHEALEAREITHVSEMDLIGTFLRESETAHDRVRKLREALDAEAQRANAEAARANQYEQALVRVQNEAHLLRESLDSAEAHIDAVARQNRKNRPKKLDPNEAALNAFAAGLYR